MSWWMVMAVEKWEDLRAVSPWGTVNVAQPKGEVGFCRVYKTFQDVPKEHRKNAVEIQQVKKTG